MKTRKTFYLILAVLAIVLSSLACGTPAPTKEAVIRPTSTARSIPTKKPTEPPPSVSCASTAGFIDAIEELYEVKTSFVFDPGVSTWDKSWTKVDQYEAVILSYNESGGCITAIGVTTMTDWIAGDFTRSGSWHGAPGYIGQDDSYVDWIQSQMLSLDCPDDIFERIGADGSLQRFYCEDTGDSYVIATAYFIEY